jgi:hypothetical protein
VNVFGGRLVVRCTKTLLLAAALADAALASSQTVLDDLERRAVTAMNEVPSPTGRAAGEGRREFLVYKLEASLGLRRASAEAAPTPLYICRPG